MHLDDERVFRLLAEHTGDAIWVVGVDTAGAPTLVYANPAFEALFGTPVTPDGWLASVAAEDRAAVAAAWTSFLRDDDALDIGCLLSPRRGPGQRRRLVGFTAEATPSAPKRWAVVARDVTAHLLADEQRRKSESFLRLLTDNIPGFIAYVDADDLVYRFVNRSFEVGFGRPRETIEGRHIRDIIGDANYRFALPFIDEVRAGRATHYENTFKLVDGPVWTRVNYVPDLDADGRTVGIMVLSYDISEARRAQEALRQERDFAELVIDATHAIVVVLDRDLTVVRFNRFGVELVGWDDATARGRDGLELFPVTSHEEERRALLRAFAGEPEQGRHGCVATRRRGVREVVWHYRLLSEAGLGADTLLAVGHDITDARAAETERRILEQRLQQSQKLEALGKLAGGVAHDMNNVLATVTGLASLLVDQLPAGGTAAELVHELMTASRRGADLTRNLLGFARKGRYRTEPTQLDSLAQQTAAMLERTIPKAVRVTTSLEAASAVIEGDPSQLSQALLNLALNAVDAVGRSGGSVEIRTFTRELGERDARPDDIAPGRYVAVQVVDDGVGMDDETARRATEPFYTTKPAGHGTGLGLSMAYGTVRAHGGALEIASRVGGGTTITMLFPASDATPPARPTPAGPSAGAEPRRAGTVLLVDDEPSVRLSTSRLLERVGYRVRQATNGLEAVDTLAAGPDEFTVVVLDMIMPVMDGATAFGHLRALAPDLPILLCTAHQDEELTARLLAHDRVALLAKPFDLHQLTEAITRLCEA